MKLFKKTSNILSTVFLCLVFIGLIVLYADSKMKEGKNSYNDVEAYEQTYELPTFSYIVATEGSNFTIKQADENKIMIWTYENELHNVEKMYNVQNDTLYVLPYKEHMNFSCKKVYPVYANKKSKVSLRDVKEPVLYLTGNNCEFEVGNSNFEELNLELTSGNFYSYKTGARTLNIHADKSKLTCNDLKVKSLNAEISNHSDINIYSSNLLNINIKCDSISNYYINK